MQIEKIKNQILLYLVSLVGEKDYNFFKWLYDKYEEDIESNDKYIYLLELLEDRIEYRKECCVA